MGSIYRRKGSPFYWISYYQDGLQKRESSGSEKVTKAKELLRKREGAIADGKPVNPKSEKIRFSDLAALVVDDYTINQYKSLEIIKARLKNHIIPAFGHRKATTITTADLTGYVIERQAGGVSNANVNRELSVIRRAFTLAIKAGLLFHKPYFPMLREDNARQGFFELEQFEKVVSKLRKPLQPVARFAYITGWRIASEILPLEWRQVDFRAGTVRLFPGMTKNRKGRVFPFTRDLRAVLEGQWIEAVRLKAKGMTCPYVFNRKGKVIRDFRAAWRKACEKAGVFGRIPHDLRRTAVRNLVRAGVPERVAMQLTGHLTRSVFERYNIVSEGDLLTAARMLDRFTHATSTNASTNLQPVLKTSA